MHHTLMHQAHMHNDQGAYVYIHHAYMHPTPRIALFVRPSVTEKFRIMDA